MVKLQYTAFGDNKQTKDYSVKYLKLHKWIGDGSHGTVYSCYWKVGNRWGRELHALKVFKDWNHQSKTPFECEKDAYDRIIQNGGDRCPVVPAQGWGELPEGAIIERSSGSLSITKNTPFLMKSLVLGRAFDLSKVDQDEMVEDIQTLGKLGIHVPDLSWDNYLCGKIADLSSAALSPNGEPVDDQSTLVKHLVLSFYGRSNVCELNDDELKDEWENLRKEQSTKPKNA